MSTLTVTQRKREKAKRKEAERRWKTQEWFPTADDLTLPDVPVEHRDRIRARIAPWLAAMKHVDDDKRIPIKVGDCWHIAQAFVLTAASPDVKYVEGVWNPLQSCASDQCECCREPKPHGWATVEGYIICLPSEFLRWQGDVNRYSLYEPLKVYDYEDVREFADDHGYWEIISKLECEYPIPFNEEEFLADDKYAERYDDALHDYAFKATIAKFMERYESEEVFAYA